MSYDHAGQNINNEMLSINTKYQAYKILQHDIALSKSRHAVNEGSLIAIQGDSTEQNKHE